MDKPSQPQYQQPTTSQPEVSTLLPDDYQPNQQNKNLWLYLLVGLVVAGGAFGFYVWQKGGLLPALPTPTPTITPTSTTTPDPTANWQTYRNEEYGFEVKYPSNWEISEDSLRTKDFVIREVGGFGIQIPEDVGKTYKSYNQNISFSRYLGDFKTLSYSELIEKVEEVSGMSRYNEIYGWDSGVKLIEIEGTQWVFYEFLPEGVTNLIYLVINERTGEVVAVQAHSEWLTPEELRVSVNQILSTFRFIE